MLAACRIVLMALLAGLDMLVMRAALGRTALTLSAGVLVALLARFHMLLVGAASCVFFRHVGSNVSINDARMSAVDTGSGREQALGLKVSWSGDG
jgi:hypothetical protein